MHSSPDSNHAPARRDDGDDGNDAQFRRMTETPVSRLICRLGAPTVASMLVTNLYNAGDAWFVSRLGTSASGAVGIVFAVMAVFQAFGFLFGHGAGSTIARLLGAGDAEGAKTYASTSFFLSLAFGTLCAALGLAFLSPAARAFGSTETILPYARDYMRWLLLSGPFLAAGCTMNNILRYEGRAFYAMVGLLSGSVLNLALDPLLMFGLGLGVSGAGLATAISQFASFAILLSMFRPGRTASRIRPRFATVRPPVVGTILAVGSPSLVRNLFNCLSPIVLNHQAAAYGDAAIAAMSIVGRVGFFMAAVSIGVGQGMQPVVGFNYGARRYARVRAAILFANAVGCATQAAVALPCALRAGAIVAWFRDDPAVVAVGALALRWQSVTLVANHVTVGTNMLFQSIGFGGRASFLSALRNGLCFLPLVTLLPRWIGVRGVALAQPAADVLSFAVALPFLVALLRKLPRDGAA